MEATLKLENELKTQGFNYIIGVDECGRGALCNSVVASAVHISEGFDVSGIKDSKKLSKKNREKQFERIIINCRYSIGLVSEKTIDKINIKEATKLAMKKAILVFDSADFVLVDGNFIPSGLNICAKPVIKGDSLSVSIAAASIVAKVFRDGLMDILHSEFPIYNWKKNKGYGTKEHRNAIEKYGPCKYHRKTFGRVKEFINVENIPF
jgi:ribonuclease HII